jgi:hypothetical protein
MNSQLATLAALCIIGTPSLAKAGNLRGGTDDDDIVNGTSATLTESDVTLKSSSWAHMIKWAHDQNFCLSVVDNRAAHGVKMQLWNCVGASGQYFTAPGQLSYLKLNMNPYFCVVVDNNANHNGAKAQVWGPCDQWNQKWSLGGDGYHGQHTIEWSVGGKCLVVDGNRAFNGAKVQIWDCNSVEPQYRTWVVGNTPGPTPPPTLPPSTPATPRSCDQACFFKGEHFSCRERVIWLRTQGPDTLGAVGTVNDECRGQCSCTLQDFGVPPLPTPSPPTPPPSSGSGTRFFQFRVKTSFSFFTSNAEKALAAAGRAAGSLGAGIEWSDDEDTSKYSFLFKVGLFRPVNRGAYINAFKEACQYEGLKWGSSGDIVEDETCINEGQACPQDWDCHDSGSVGIVQCADYCCGPFACVTDRFGQNPGVCKTQ